MISIIKKGYGDIFKRKFNIVALIGIIIISMLFGLLCVIAFWNPQENLKNMPVAVVNLDEGEAGKEIVENLDGNDRVRWEVTEENIFENGIEDTDYYFAFLIPQDFTEKTAAAKDGTPTTAQLYYYSNERKSFLLSQLSAMIKEEFNNTIASSITKEYTVETFDRLDTVKTGLGKAGKGSKKLYAGTQSMNAGIGQLSTGAGTLSEGVKTLDEKSRQYASAMKSLTEGTSTLRKGAAEFEKSSKKVASSVGTLRDGANSVGSGIKKLSSSMNKANTAYSNGMRDLTAAYEGIMNNPNMTDGQKLQALQQWFQQLDKAYSNYMTAQTSINDGMTDLSSGVSSLKGGAAKLNEQMPAFESGAASLTSGAKNIEGASETLYQGSQALSAGTEALQGGAASVKAGTDQLGDRSVDLSKGVGSLNSSLNKSYKELDGKLKASSDEMGGFVSHPVETEDAIYGDVENYGTGFSPLFMSLGLWLGALMLFFIINFRPSDVINPNRFQIVFGKYVVFATFAVLEALAISTGALLIGVHVTSIPIFIGFAVIVSLVFLSIIQCFHIVFGPLVSKAFSVLMVILQISSGGGTFPAELCGGFFDAIHPYVPFSYSIDGFREIISGGNGAMLFQDIGCLLIFMAIFFALSLIFCKKERRRGGTAQAQSSAS